MTQGKLYGEGRRIKWAPDHKKRILGIFLGWGYPLGESDGFRRSRVEAWRCEKFKKILLDG